MVIIGESWFVWHSLKKFGTAWIGKLIGAVSYVNIWTLQVSIVATQLLQHECVQEQIGVFVF